MLKCFASESTEIASIVSLQTKNSLIFYDIKDYIKDIFCARSVVAAGSKVIVGVLVDKPIFVLLSQYKQPQQKIMAINESFFYSPFRSFDYNMLDVYFSLNEMDEVLQNKFGGKIGEFVRVEFVRKSLVPTSNGISDDLKELIACHDRVAVAAPMQVSETGFSQWGTKELNDFVYNIIQSANKNPKDLFIIKGKKNELSHLDDRNKKHLSKIKNIFTIHSVKPRLLKYNQFEDLLDVADIIISMSHTSTTIWQALAEDIPAIAINDAHPSSFLSDYDLVEIPSSNLPEVYKSWFDLDVHERRQKIRSLASKANLGTSSGLAQIADYISNQ